MEIKKEVTKEITEDCLRKGKDRYECWMCTSKKCEGRKEETWKKPLK